MTALSVVIANKTPHTSEAAPAVAAMTSQLAEGDQLVWVDQAGLAPWAALGGATLLEVQAGAGRGECYGAGLASVRNPLVAFTDSSSIAAPGWREAAVAAIEGGATVVGGPVLPTVPSSTPTWAGFLVDYASHAAPPFLSASGDVASNNVAYRREVLPDSGPVWKTQVNARLRAQGIAATVVAGMSVTLNRSYRWADLGLPRTRSGALYASHRSRGWSPSKRGLAAMGCGGLPFLAFWRMWSTVHHDVVLRRALFSSLPGVAAAYMSWSAGEFMGYLSRKEVSSDVW